MQVITRSELGGAQSVLCNLSNYLSKEHEIIVVAGGDGKMWGLLNPRIVKKKLKYLRREISPLYDFIASLHLLIIYFKYNPDIVHLHSSKIGIIGRLIFPKSRIVYTVHGFDSIRLHYRKFLPIERYLQSRCKYIAAVSKYDVNNLKDESIIKNVRCIYNGVSEPEVNNNSFSLLPQNLKKNILSIARLEKPKRFDIFVETARILPQHNFVWIGNNEPQEHLPANVFCLGNISNAARYNLKCDLFMLASDFEGLPIVILEAMSYGKPIVASDVGGIRELICVNEAGYIVKNNPQLFAEKIVSLLENVAEYNRISQNAYQSFKRSFTIENMANDYLKLYSDIF